MRTTDGLSINSDHFTLVWPVPTRQMPPGTHGGSSRNVFNHSHFFNVLPCIRTPDHRTAHNGDDIEELASLVRLPGLGDIGDEVTD